MDLKPGSNRRVSAEPGQTSPLESSGSYLLQKKSGDKAVVESDVTDIEENDTVYKTEKSVKRLCYGY